MISWCCINIEYISSSYIFFSVSWGGGGAGYLLSAGVCVHWTKFSGQSFILNVFLSPFFIHSRNIRTHKWRNNFYMVIYKPHVKLIACLYPQTYLIKCLAFVVFVIDYFLSIHTHILFQLDCIYFVVHVLFIYCFLMCVFD
jgi:hypothetical protein